MEKILLKVKENLRLCKILRLLSHLTGVLAFILYLSAFVLTLLSSPLGALKMVIILGVSYVLVSLFRKVINAPRPYELYSFYDLPPKNKTGVSFPSRHSFLVFAIAALCFPLLPLPSLVLLLFGVMQAVSRVLLGIHFIRDVVCGALLGVISSLIGLLVLFPYI